MIRTAHQILGQR